MSASCVPVSKGNLERILAFQFPNVKENFIRVVHVVFILRKIKYSFHKNMAQRQNKNEQINKKNLLMMGATGQNITGMGSFKVLSSTVSAIATYRHQLY